MKRMIWLSFLLICMIGCGGREETEVSGTVLMDGQPLAEGEIIFEDVAGATTPGAGKIESGKYKILVKAGSKKVKILASRATSKVDKLMGSAAREQALGSEYNTETKLKAEIQTGKQTGVDFEVKELPKGK
ncbi:MAG: hypothetical protein ACRC8S_15875 [Fimbriiglobus sp.]